MNLGTWGALGVYGAESSPVTATGAFSIPSMTVVGSVSVTTPNPIINGNITFNKLTVSATGSATSSQPEINGNIQLPKLTVNANGSVTLPQPVANGAFVIPSVSVSGFATISGLRIIVNRQTNITQTFYSNNITYN